jgi:hypothetical protein
VTPEQRIREVLRTKSTSFTSLRYFSKLAKVHTVTAQIHFDCDKALYDKYLFNLERNRIAKHRARVLLVENYQAKDRAAACKSLGVCYATYHASKRRLKEYYERKRKAA